MSAAGTLRAGSAEQPLELPIAHADIGVTAKGKGHAGTSKLVWLAVPLGVVVGAAIGVGLYYGLSPR